MVSAVTPAFAMTLIMAVSYTHLDVYKRQSLIHERSVELNEFKYPDEE